MRICPVCQAKVIGRSDKKFCSNDCKALFHNNRNRNVNSMVRKTNRILIRNRRLLSEFYKEGKIKVDRNVMLREGFDFSVFTRINICSEGRQYFFCYDLAYSYINNSKCGIVKDEE